MTIDVNAFLQALKDGLLKAGKLQLAELEEEGKAYLSAAEHRVALLAEGLAKGEADIKFVLDHVKDEAVLLQSEGIYLKIIGLGFAGDAYTTALGIVVNAVLSSLFS